MACKASVQSRRWPEAKAFIVASTRIVLAPGLPIRLDTADELTPIWKATEKDLAEADVAPPFWAFPWAGGQALARYVLDNPEIVRGKRVLRSCLRLRARRHSRRARRRG